MGRGERFPLRDCGGFEADMLEDGSARCRTCGRVSVPTRPRRTAGLGRAFLLIFCLFLAVVAIELGATWAVAGGSVAAFRGSFPVLAVITGIVIIIVAGIGAAPGRIAMGTQRYDYLGRMLPLQNPEMVGLLSPESKARDAEEPGLVGIVVLVALGVVLIIAAFVVTVA